MNRIKFTLLILTITFWAVSPQLFGQYILKKSVIGNGGGKTSNSSVRVSYTVGQPIIGISQNASNIGKFGFWYNSTTGPVPYTLDIPLAHGWNIISSNIVPPSFSMSTIWSPIVDNLLIIKNGRGQYWMPSNSTGTLENWNNLDGYQVYITTPCTLSFTGQRVAPNTPIAVNGWNMISYLPAYGIAANQALCTIQNILVIVKNGNGEFYWPAFGANSLEQYNAGNEGKMLPTKGYLVYTVNPGGFVDYTCPMARGQFYNDMPESEPKNIQLIASEKNTGNDASLVLEVVNIPDGSEIGVYTGSGKLVGTAVVNKGRAAATIWGDNYLTTGQIEGAAAGEILNFKAILPQNNEMVDVRLSNVNDLVDGSITSNLKYRKDGLYIATGSIDEDMSNINLKVSPNPFAVNTSIEFTITETSYATLELYNVQGQRVATVAEGQYDKGFYRVPFDSGELSSGVYSLVLRSGDKKLAKNIIINK